MRTTRFLALFACAALAAPSFADRVITKDQRVLTCKKARPEGNGYKLVFESGEVVVPDKSQLLSVEVEGDMSDYVPANDDEKKKLADGYVRYEGKWLSKPAYESVLKQNYEKSKKRLEEIAAHASFDSGWTKDTAHFSFKTNTSPQLLDYYCNLLEAYYDLQDQRIGINPTLSMRRTKMQVNIYKNYNEFREQAPYGEGGKVPFGVIGFFSSTDGTLNFYHDYPEPSRSTWVALHECTHLLTYLIDQSYMPQIWLNEGVADYFGSSRIEYDKKGKIKIIPGEVQTDRVLTVQDAIRFGATSTGGGGADAPKGKSSVIGRPFIKLKDLLFVSRDAFKGFEYAHAWSFVYFLNNFQNGKYQKAFNQFFKGLYTLEKGIPYESLPYGNKSGNGKQVKPEDIRDYLMKKLGVKDLEALEADWKKFVEQIPIEGPTARLKRGLMAVRSFQFDEAIDDLDAAITGGTQDPRAWAARAQVHAVNGRWKEAQEDIKAAVDKDPLNAAYHYSYSRFLEKQITLRSGDIDESNVSVQSKSKFSDPAAKQHAGLASELDPENVEFQGWRAKFE